MRLSEATAVLKGLGELQSPGHPEGISIHAAARVSLSRSLLSADPTQIFCATSFR